MQTYNPPIKITEEESTLAASREITTSPKDKVLPGECHELKKDIQSIFEEEKDKSCKMSISFKDCFSYAKYPLCSKMKRNWKL